MPYLRYRLLQGNMLVRLILNQELVGFFPGTRA